LSVSAHLSMTSSLLTYWAGIKHRLGLPRQKLLTITIDLPKGIHIAKRYLRLMQALSDREFSAQTELFWDDKVEDKVTKLTESYMQNKQDIVGIAPGSVWKTKRWLPEYYVQLIKDLRQHGVYTVLIGGKDDAELCNKISYLTGVEPLNMSGKLSVLGSAALIKRLKLLITNDSAPMHIANAVQTDVIAIFGPTVRRFGFFPYRAGDIILETDLDCRPCGKHGGQKCPQKHFRCMKDISPELVLNAVLHKLKPD
jgi:heptosyltransferase II